MVIFRLPGRRPSDILHDLLAKVHRRVELCVRASRSDRNNRRSDFNCRSLARNVCRGNAPGHRYLTWSRREGTHQKAARWQRWM